MKFTQLEKQSWHFLQKNWGGFSLRYSPGRAQAASSPGLQGYQFLTRSIHLICRCQAGFFVHLSLESIETCLSTCFLHWHPLCSQVACELSSTELGKAFNFFFPFFFEQGHSKKRHLAWFGVKSVATNSRSNQRHSGCQKQFLLPIFCPCHFWSTV